MPYECKSPLQKNRPSKGVLMSFQVKELARELEELQIENGKLRESGGDRAQLQGEITRRELEGECERLSQEMAVCYSLLNNLLPVLCIREATVSFLFVHEVALLASASTPSVSPLTLLAHLALVWCYRYCSRLPVVLFPD